MNATLTAEAALNRHYLETRCKIIEIAANLVGSRVGCDVRGGDPESRRCASDAVGREGGKGGTLSDDLFPAVRIEMARAECSVGE
jgi:hypothetical protein